TVPSHPAAPTSCSSRHVPVRASVTGSGSGCEQAGSDGRLSLLALGASLLATHVARALLSRRVPHYPGDHGGQAGFLLLGGQFAPIAPLAQLDGSLEVFIDFGGDVFDGFDIGRHGRLPVTSKTGILLEMAGGRRRKGVQALIVGGPP